MIYLSESRGHVALADFFLKSFSSKYHKTEKKFIKVSLTKFHVLHYSVKNTLPANKKGKCISSNFKTSARGIFLCYLHCNWPASVETG